jgi:hypothetical protein
VAAGGRPRSQGNDLVSLVFDGDRRRVEQVCGQAFTHVYVLASRDTLAEAKAALEGMAERLGAVDTQSRLAVQGWPPTPIPTSGMCSCLLEGQAEAEAGDRDGGRRGRTALPGAAGKCKLW